MRPISKKPFYYVECFTDSKLLIYYIKNLYFKPTFFINFKIYKKLLKLLKYTYRKRTFTLLLIPVFILVTNIDFKEIRNKTIPIITPHKRYNLVIGQVIRKITPTPRAEPSFFSIINELVELFETLSDPFNNKKNEIFKKAVEHMDVIRFKNKQRQKTSWYRHKADLKKTSQKFKNKHKHKHKHTKNKHKHKHTKLRIP